MSGDSRPSPSTPPETLDSESNSPDIPPTGWAVHLLNPVSTFAKVLVGTLKLEIPQQNCVIANQIIHCTSDPIRYLWMGETISDDMGLLQSANPTRPTVAGCAGVLGRFLID